MPIISSAGALTYTKNNLGDPNYTYWMLKATGVTGTLKGMYVDNTNEVIYVQSLTSTGPNIVKLNRIISPEVEYNVTTRVTDPGTNDYRFMGYMGYDVTTDEIVIPLSVNDPYVPGPPFTVGYPILIYVDSSTGAITNDYRRRTFFGAPSGNNQIYTNTFQAAINGLGYLYTCFLDHGLGSDRLQAIRYSSGPSSAFDGAIQVNPNPYTPNVNNTFGRMVFDSSNNSISSVMVYGTTLNEIRWYTNSPIAVGSSFDLTTIASSTFTLTGKRLQAGELTLDTNDNIVGAIFNSTDNNSFVVKTNSSHSVQWQKAVTGIKLYNVATDSNDNVYVSGLIASNNRLFFAKFDSSGTTVWQRQIYGSGPYDIPNIECDSSDELIISCSDNNQPLVMRLPSDGTKTGTYTLGASNITYASVIASVGTGGLSVTTPVSTTGSGSVEPWNFSVTTSLTTGSDGSIKTPVT